MMNSWDLVQLTFPLKFILVMYIMNKIHTLNMLIVIEYAAVVMTMMLFNLTAQMALEFHMILFMMILLITESILGLSILISMIRTHGSDYIKSSSIVVF